MQASGRGREKLELPALAVNHLPVREAGLDFYHQSLVESAEICKAGQAPLQPAVLSGHGGLQLIIMDLRWLGSSAWDSD
jgi:hypothetical protein